MNAPSVTDRETLRQRIMIVLAAAGNYLVLAVAALLYIAPILFMIVASFKPDDRVLPEAGSWQAFFPDQVTTENYGDVFERVRFGRYMFNSILITGSIVVGGLVVNSLAAYALARLQWWGRTAIFRMVLALMILPIQAIAVPLFYEATVLGWRDTYIAQIIPFVANAFSIYLFYAFFIGMPREFEEAARIDGAGVWRTLIEVILPNAKPAFAAVAITTFLMYWGLYLWPLMITTHEDVRPLPLAMATFRTLPPLKWADIMAFAVMMVGPVLVVFIVFQRWFVRGVATSGIKG